MTKTRKTTHTPCSGKDDPRPVAASALPMCLAYGKQILPDRSGNVISLSSRAPQVEYLLTVLNSPEHRNAILVGRPGVGKTTLLRELAALIEDGSAGEELGGAVIIEIDMNRLKGGSGISGAMEKIVHTLWKEAEMYSSYPVIQAWHVLLQARALEFQGKYMQAAVLYEQVSRVCPTWHDGSTARRFAR